MTDYLLECLDVSKSFGTVAVLHGATIAAKSGEIVALLGPSGSGKTTALRLIAGFDYPDSGMIRLNGRVVASGTIRVPAEDRRVGMVFQEYALFPHLSVEDNIAFGLKGSKREKSERAAVMMSTVGLSGYGARMPHELSGGQQQRVALARALAPQPEILLLDEPFSNLDAALRAQVRQEVRAILKGAGMTCVFVTHDQQEALSFADQVAVLMGGQVAQFADPQTLYRAPATREVAAFVGEVNFIPAHADGESARCALGALRLESPLYGEVEVLIRPEAIRILDRTEGNIPARVIWREYYGHDQRVGLRINDDLVVIARAGAWQTIHEGELVGVWVTHLSKHLKRCECDP